MKEWLISNIEIDMLWHYIFGMWAGIIAVAVSPQITSIFIATTVVAFSKETYDYYDYGFFSWKDIVFTYCGGITSLILIYI